MVSNLNPGGSRGGGPRVFGAAQISRVCQDGKVPEVDKANGSIAGEPHQHSREVARRLRQEARKASKS